MDTGSKKDSGLESGDVSDSSEEPQQPAAKAKGSLLQDSPPTANRTVATQLDTSRKTSSSLLNKTTTSTSSRATSKPVYEMKIQSALATSILQLRKGVLTKTKSFDTHSKPKQMVSVLKKPPMTPQKQQQQLLAGCGGGSGNYLKESIVTTTNSSNDQVQNIIVQDTSSSDLDLVESKPTAAAPARRKLNLAEYRSRREQNRSDGSRTNSPVQPMALVYIHHVSTNTEPINDDPDNPIWSEREIVSVLKPKAEVEEERVQVKRPTRDRGMQTTQSVFGLVYEDQPEEEEQQQPEEAPVEEAEEAQEEGELDEEEQEEAKFQPEEVRPIVKTELVEAVAEADAAMPPVVVKEEEPEPMELGEVDDEIESGEITNEGAEPGEHPDNDVMILEEPSVPVGEEKASATAR